LLLSLHQPGELSRYSDGLRTRRQGFNSRQRLDIFLYFTVSRPLLGPPINWVPVVLFPEVKRPGREADTSSPSSAEIKNGGGILPRLHRVIPLFTSEVVETQ
jgi:hypothetical protein